MTSFHDQPHPPPQINFLSLLRPDLFTGAHVVSSLIIRPASVSLAHARSAGNGSFRHPVVTRMEARI